MTLINLKGKDQIAAVAKVPTSKDEEVPSEGDEESLEGDALNEATELE